MRRSWSLRLQMYLASHPHLANRVSSFLGAKRVETMGRQAALQAARRAYEQVPFYHNLFTQHGFTADRVRRLTWNAFQQLPKVNKDDTEAIAEADLLDRLTPSPRGDALIGRSSGTTRAPVHWPLGWPELYLSRAAFEAILRELGTATGVPTAVVLMTAVEGGDQSGNMPYRAFYSLKEQYGWDMEVIATGEDSATAHNWFHWLAHNGYKAFFLISFPGTIERLLTYIASLPEAERVNWGAFQRKHVLLGGQIVARQIRERVRQEMQLDPTSLTSETVIYVSSDTGQIMARTTPFTLWLERYLTQHPELYPAFGLAEEHQTKPLLEFVPPPSIHFEFDQPEGLTLTMWKHRPLIRYKIGDLIWTRQAQAVIQLLSKLAPHWREDFLQAGGHRLDIPSVSTLGVVLGRADEICIVNGANISPAMVQQALETSGILPQINHFKHRADPAHPNEYHLYVELKSHIEASSRVALADQWREPLLTALLQAPAATDLAAAHRTNPITLFLFARSPGEDEFLSDQEYGKKTYALRRVASKHVPE